MHDQCERHDDQRPEQQQFGPGEPGEPERDTDRDGRPSAAAKVVHVDREEHGDDTRCRKRLGHQQPVVDPQVRIDRSDQCRHERDATTEQPPGQQSDADHHEHAVDGHQETLGEERIVVGPRHRREQQRGERCVVSGEASLDERVGEPAAVRDHRRLERVVDLVAEQFLAALGAEHVGDTEQPGEPHDRCER